MVPLLELDVLVVDCQATGASPRGHILELGWAQAGRTPAAPSTFLIKLPESERIPPAVARITGISERMSRQGVDAEVAWRALSAHALRLPRQPAPTVAHFARFERPFLEALAGGTPRLDLVCTHGIARRLLPDLPRCTLRALAGYFGRAVGSPRRSADHVAATAFVWRELVGLLEARGISTWSDLKEWLGAPATKPKGGRRAWPMPRDVRLALPDAPGIYRMLRTSGDVLYVGKAASLRARVNSYFRHRHGVHERLLEMLTQARGLSYEIAASALEAALLEPDEIKRLRPPYNVALTEDLRPKGGWHLSAKGASHLFGPREEVTRELLRLGTRLWQQGRRGREGEVEDAESAEADMEQSAIRAALARRRERWLARLAESTIVWSEAGVERARLLVLHNAEIVSRDDVARRSVPPVPPGHARTLAARREAFTMASYDRLRVLLTELKRLVSQRSPVAVRLGPGRPLEGARLARVLSWL